MRTLSAAARAWATEFENSGKGTYLFGFEESYGCIVLIALIGITLYTIVEMIEKRIVLWKK